VSDIIKQYNTDAYLKSSGESEELIRIESQLKKEELNFYPNQFIYAESDGNYTAFHLNLENQIKRKIIRNSISNIEQQLSSFPFLFRTHRAFIVNIKTVNSQKGNTLGYRLKLSGIDIEIPVSRQKTRDFDQILKRYH
jgi:DNA-binding LytR/AlgR family response regulator